MPPKVIALVGGGQAAGKKSICNAISKRLQDWQVSDIVIVSLSDFAQAVDEASNPEGPEAIDFIRAEKYITALSNSLVIVEGMYALYAQTLRKLGNIRIYVDLDADLRLSRRITRDTERGLDLSFVLDNYLKHAKPAMEQFIIGTKPTADVVLMRGTEPSGIELIAGAIFDLLTAERTADVRTVHSDSGGPAWQASSLRGFKQNLLEADRAISFYELA
ncbi:uncharacterized protein V1516DRAFT_676881 [Lipomyces oligophaga]|uniref:uncharacterized protein n=1 Tax=Lipomyces oligophaga TaxID=45792 RepID=UPI0034CD33F9